MFMILQKLSKSASQPRAQDWDPKIDKGMRRSVWGRIVVIIGSISAPLGHDLT